MRTAISTLLACVSVFATVLVFSGNENGYSLMPLLPISFMVSYYIFLNPAFKNGNYKLSVFFAMATFAFVCLVGPAIYALIGAEFIGNRYFYLNPGEIEFSILLIGWNVFFGSALLWLITKILGSYHEIKVSESLLQGNRLCYALFILLALVSYFLFAQGTGLVSFFFAFRSESDDIEIGSVDLLIRQSVFIAMSIVFLWVVDANREGGTRTEKARLLRVLIPSIFLVGMVVGGRRSVQLFTAALVILFLLDRFPRYKAVSVISIIGLSLFVIAMVSLSRWFGGLETAELDLGAAFWSLYFQSYFSGPDSIATPLRFFSEQSPSAKIFIFDFFRSIFGFSFLLKNYSMTTSQLYNDYLYAGSQLTGQLIFAPAYGYHYLGFIASPLIIASNFLLAALLERCFRTSSSLEFKFLFGYCFFRVAFNLMVNTPTIINVVTVFLGTMGVLFLISTSQMLGLRKSR